MTAHREEITRTVTAIDPADTLEAEHRHAVLDWIASGAELYRRVPPDQPPMHLVSYFVPFDTKSASLLLAAHRKSGLILPPGGHCEPGELPWQTVQRECAEELGISATSLPWLGTSPVFVTVTPTQGSAVPRHTDVSLWHVVESERGDQRLRPDRREFDGVNWYSFDELLAQPIERFDPHLHRFTRKLRAAGSLAATGGNSG